MKINRRSALRLGTVAASAAVLGAGTAALAQESPAGSSSGAAEQSRRKIAQSYGRQVKQARGTWSSLITVAEPTGLPMAAVEDNADRVVEAYSVNKIAVAIAVLDKVDRGLIRLDQRVDVVESIVAKDTDGVFGLDGAYPSQVTIGHVLSTMLTVSDNTSVRLCGLVCPAQELNEILRAKGFPMTQVVPLADKPNRFFLGTTTPRETHALLRQLVDGTLLSANSTRYLLNILRSLSAFTDGVRLNLSSTERLRVATKAGWFADGRNEAGIIFCSADRPVLIYSMFASGTFAGDKAANDENFGFTHPAVGARAALGRTMYDAAVNISTTQQQYPPLAYRMANGG
ncbi:serine hydrolase [Lentzea tibetensis]|uniref:Beta-lactamase n=1 Tax=Lentzea tibetensis TaxID=2591470 RepID=A0A563EWU5_9PSEU|nr:serine hydrolase [Lentzea tibetensis]TWP52170.1 serine hydrolase [Lentzea tibetensis]